MSSTDNQQPDRPDPKSYEGFIARAYDEGGIKRAVKEAEKHFKGCDDREALNAAASMQPKVRTAVMKMVNSRKSP